MKIGNSDMHLKNFSLKEAEPGNKQFSLSKAYDLLPVNIILPMDEEQLALTLNGKKRNIRKKDFKIFAKNCGIPEKSAQNMLKKMCSLKDKFIAQCEESFLPEDLKQDMKKLIENRIEILS